MLEKEPKKNKPSIHLTWHEIQTIRHTDTEDAHNKMDGLSSPTPNPSDVSPDVTRDSLKYDNV